MLFSPFSASHYHASAAAAAQTLPVDARAAAHPDGQMDGIADEFLAGALSEQKQFKAQGREAI